MASRKQKEPVKEKKLSPTKTSARKGCFGIPKKTRLKHPSKDSYSVEGAQHVTKIAGPILFTAPHGLKVYRGGTGGERLRVHKREFLSSELALMASREVANILGFEGSFIVWNMKTGTKLDKNNMDPNYLLDSEQPHSPWHQSLHVFREKFAGMPIFHVDLHGKMDRKTNLDLDIGVMPMEEEWPEHDFGSEEDVETMLDSLGEGMRLAMKGTGKHKKANMSFGVECDPTMHGYWGSDTVKTLSHQSVLLGIPAVQLEIPLTMRKALFSDPAFFERFIQAICTTYTDVISPMFAATESLRPVLPSCPFSPAVSPDADVSEMLAEFAILEEQNDEEKQI